MAFSTCKGPKLQPGDPLEVSFPEQSAGTGKGPFEVRKPWGHSKGTAEIVHFSCGEWGEFCCLSYSHNDMPSCC